jgi:hypothetical protein
MRNLVIFVNLFFLLNTLSVAAPAPPPAIAKTIEQRLHELEIQKAQFDQWYSDFYFQSKGRITPFLGEKISFGGFFETGITHLSGPDTPGQTSANSNVLGINIAADFNERMRFVSQFLSGFSYVFQNPNNNPNLTPSQRQFAEPSIASLVAQAFVEYRKSEAFSIQSGLGYVPFGHAFQQREPVLFKRRSGPQLVSAADSNSVGIAFPLWMGLHALGNFSLNTGRIGYNLYTFSPSTNSKTLGGGSRFWWSNSKNVTAGVSLQSGEDLNHSYYSYGADVDVKIKNFGFLLEYGKSVWSGSAKPLVSYYFEPYYDLYEGEWLVYAAADYIDHPNHSLGAVVDAYEKWQLGFGLNWLPIPNARFRFGIINNDYINETDSIAGQRRDYYSIDLSVGLAY